MSRRHDHLVRSGRPRAGAAAWMLALGTALGVSGCGSGAVPPGSDSSAGATVSPSTSASPNAASSGQPSAGDGNRVDLGEPTFSDPTSITNPLFPISDLTQVVQLGAEAGHSLRHDITLLPETKTIDWNGQQVESLVSQFMAYKDGRLLEVAFDYFAQADDGSVWYFGEDVYNYENGVVADTEGTWLAGKDGPPGMIMPADPQVGDVYRPENIPDLVFEEVTVKAVDQTVDGPTGPVIGAIRVQERLLDGVLEDKVFAPGYGEFEASVPSEDELATVAIGVPTDATPGGVGSDQLIDLSARATAAFEAASSSNPTALATAAQEVAAAWAAYPAADAPTLLATQLADALAALGGAADSQNLHAARQAALGVELAALDLRMRSEPVPGIDLTRLDVRMRQIGLDAGGADGAAGKPSAAVKVLDAVATAEALWDRVDHAVDAATIAEVSAGLQALRAAADRGDLAAAGSAAAAIRDSLARAAHDPRVLADLATAGEAVLIKELDRRAEEEAALCFAAGGHLGDGLDESTAEMGDLVEGAASDKRRPSSIGALIMGQ